MNFEEIIQKSKESVYYAGFSHDQVVALEEMIDNLAKAMKKAILNSKGRNR